MIVYKITNKINNKVYIGITTKPLSVRWNGHIQRYKSNDTRHLYRAMNKYGIENFNIEVINDSISNREELMMMEQYYISLYNSTDSRYGYNMTPGGDINPMHSLIVKEKHDTIMRTEQTRNKISNSLSEYRKNHPFSEEHRKKLSESAKGNHNFGSGDTRSVECYCVLSNGEKHYFHNYKIAGKWWYDNFHPFGDAYSESTFQRKIKSSIKGEEIRYKRSGGPEIIVTNIKWYKGGGNNE